MNIQLRKRRTMAREQNIGVRFSATIQGSRIGRQCRVLCLDSEG
jgi:hypothetical protein